MMMTKKVNKHAEIIANTVFHSYPYKLTGMFKPDSPHAEDCGGCIINAEVEKLVDELNALSNVEKIIAELGQERNARLALSLERKYAFEKAGVPPEGSVTELVITLVEERDRLAKLVGEIKDDVTIILERLR